MTPLRIQAWFDIHLILRSSAEKNAGVLKILGEKHEWCASHSPDKTLLLAAGTALTYSIDSSSLACCLETPSLSENPSRKDKLRCWLTDASSV